jgi:hypothetical protein
MRNRQTHLAIALVLASLGTACAAEQDVPTIGDETTTPPAAPRQPEPTTPTPPTTPTTPAAPEDDITEDRVVPTAGGIWAPETTEVANCEAPAHGLARTDLRQYPRDAKGWTILRVPASEAEGRIIHVSAAYSQNKTRPQGAKAHEFFVSPAEIADKKITTWLRPGTADQIWFARGETFTLNLDLISARGSADPTRPMVFRAEPGSGARPILQGTIGAALSRTSAATVKNMIFADLDLAAPSAGEGYGIHLSKDAATTGAVPVQIDNLLFEGVRVRGFGTNVSIEARRFESIGFAYPIRNIMFRRSQSMDAKSIAGAYAQGMYIEGVSGLLIEESVFDANGVQTIDAGTLAVTRSSSDKNQNVYINARNNCVVFRGNVSARAQSYALQLRAGGLAEDNFFGYSPNLLTFGHVRGDAVNKKLLPAGVTGAVRRNALWVGTKRGTSQGSGGMHVGNIARANIDKNLVAHTETPTPLSFGISLSAFVGVGIHQLNINNNCISKVHHAFEGYGKLYGPGAINADGSVTVRDGSFTAECSPKDDDCTGITPPGASVSIADPGKSVVASGNQSSNIVNNAKVVLSANEEIAASNAALNDGYSLVDYVVAQGLPAPANDEAAMRIIAGKAREMTRGTWDARWLGASISAALRKGFGGACQ